MSVAFDFADRVAVVTGASGTLGGAVVEAFVDTGAHVAAVDVVEPGSLPDGATFHEADLTDEGDVDALFDRIGRNRGRIDHLANVAGTWRGGTPVDGTDEGTFDLLVDVNLRTVFLATKHALPHLRETGGTVVSVSARSSLEGGEGDGPYRAAKAGVRLLTESVAAENLGRVRANSVMPSVIDTPENREAMPEADHESWVDPADIATTVLALCSDATAVTSGAAVPVYGEA